MCSLRVAVAWLIASACFPAAAGNAGGSFGITLHVVASRRVAQPTRPAAAFVGLPGSPSLPCGARDSAACATALAVARSASSRTVLLTSFPDGAPTAVVER